MAVIRSADTGRCSGLDITVNSQDTSVIPGFSLDIVKSFIRVDFTNDDYLINILMDSAISKVEQYCGISLRTKNLTATYDTISTLFEIPYGPIQSVIAVTDGLGNALNYNLSNSTFTKIQILNVNTDLYINSYETYFGAEPVNWSVSVNYLAGYTYGQIPSQIVHAMLKMVATDYDTRNDFEVTRGALIEYSNDHKALLDQYKRKPGW